MYVGQDTGGQPGPLQLLSERLIAAAGRGDTEAVTRLVQGGRVSLDVADATGLTAVLAASVRSALLAHRERKCAEKCNK